MKGQTQPQRETRSCGGGALRRALLLVAAAWAIPATAERAPPPPQMADGYKIETLVAGSPFHTINGLAFDASGYLYAASMVGESIFKISPDMAHVTTLLSSQKAQSDDLVVTADGAVIWTAMIEGVVRRRDRDGSIRDIATGISGVNPIVLSPDGKRLFVGQVLLGDSLWEVDPLGREPARKIVDGIGSMNAFAFGPDGLLYAPRYSDQSVIKIDTDTGKVAIVAPHLGRLVSVRVAPDGSLLVLNGLTGELLEIRDGKTRRVAALSSTVDNVALSRDGHAFVVNMAEGSIHKVDIKTGRTTQLFKAKLVFPSDIALGPDGLYVADVYALRKVDPVTGAISEILRDLVSPLMPITGISVADGHAVVVCETFGMVQLVDLATKSIASATGFDHPLDAVRTADGRLLVIAAAKGELIEVAGDARRTIASGLQAPAGIADGGDGSVYIAESGAGAITVIDLATGARRTVASGLGKPRALALSKDGLVVLDVAEGRVFRIDRKTGDTRIVASGLAVGHLADPYPRSGGIALGGDGAIYVAADKENAIYKIIR